MPTLILLITVLIPLVIIAVILTETRFGRLRWMLADAAQRIQALEAQTRSLSAEVSALRRGPTTGVAPPPPPPSPEASFGQIPVAPEPMDPMRASAPQAAAADPTLGQGSPDAEVAPATTPLGGSVPPVPPQTTAVPPPPPPPPQPQASLEERLGTRWAVWVGGLALALGGILLVRYSIEQGFFGPGMRVFMGLLFSGLLVGGGEWLRRTGHKPALDALPQAHVPSILTAAGSLTLFGTIYAAHALYGFIGPALAFILLGAVGVLTMFAAALHGPALAGLGLVAAYGAPVLVSSSRPSPWPLVIYLAVVAASAMGLAHMRRWLWLASVAIVGAVIWGFLFAAPIRSGIVDWTLAGELHTVIQLALAAITFGWLAHGATRDQDARIDPIGTMALSALTLLVVVMLIAGRHQTTATIAFTLASAGLLLATAWLSPRMAPASIMAGVAVLAAIATWPGLRTTEDTSHLLREVAGVLLVPENVVTFLMLATVGALGVAAISTLRLMRGQALPEATAGSFLLAATVTPLLALVLTYLRVTQFDTSISYAFAAAVLGLLFVLLTERFQRAELLELPGTRLATGAYAAAAIAALSLGLVAALSRGYLTLALALTALGTAYIADRRDIPMLRHVVTALAGIVLARVAWEPRIMGENVGSWPILNWLLIGYGVPAAAFYGAARFMERRGASVPSRIADAVSVLLAGLLGFYQVRHLMHGGDVWSPVSGHLELGLMALVAFGLSFALMRLDLGRANPVFRFASMAFGCISGLVILLGLGIFENPLFESDIITGKVIFSSLLLGYLVPGIAAVFLARAARPHRPRWYVTGIAVLAVLLIFGYVTLEIRHAFQGPIIIETRRTSPAEWWSYSAAWLWLGLCFLAYGIFRGSIEARLASAALILLAVLKAFLFDLAGLTGLWRALSFIVLGVVLIGIGLAYQHLVFANRGRRPPPAPASPPGPMPAA